MNKIATLNSLFQARKINAKVVDYKEKLRTVEYHIELELDEKVSKIKQLEEDILLQLKLDSINFKINNGLLIIETASNNNPITIELESLLEQGKGTLPIIIGKDVDNNTISIDLQDSNTPHVLIGGQTGAGKSVLLNSIIRSLLYKKEQTPLELVLIDPKGVELYEFKDKAIAYTSDYSGAVHLLNQLVIRMEKTYKFLQQENKKQLKDVDSKNYTPYICVVIDELGDLLIQDQKKAFKNSLIRLLQKARAAGIHIICATQNPKREVVDGLIKSNMPVKIAFKVNSPIESKIILDQEGAENLVGKGDLLISYSGKVIRGQGAISTEELTSNKKSNIFSISRFRK